MPGSKYGSSVAVLAPRGRDAKVAADLLEQEGFQAHIAEDLAELETFVAQHIGAVLIAEESISGPGDEVLRTTVANQPAWSDLPFIVLTNGMKGTRGVEEERRIDALGNVLLLARPMHRDDIVRAVRSALKARQRQFEARARMDELRDSEQNLAASREVLERTVAERTQELADLYQKTPVALHSLDRDERIVSVSDRWLSFMNFDHADQVIGRLAIDFVAEESLEDHNGPYRAKLAAEGVVHDLPYTVLKNGGQRAEVLISARIAYDDDGNLERLMASVVDITERKQAEAARDKAEDALRQSQKLETIGQLTGGVAHDFNNLLMAIRSSLELLRRRLPEADDRSVSFLDNALAGVDRGATLTKRMLAFARKQELDTKAVNIADLLPGMRELIERSIGPRIDIDLSISAKVADAMVDANQLEMALLNLALNARDAMEGSGRLTIGLDCVELTDQAEVEDGSYVRLRVADTGPGMDAATLAKATEPFFTTKGVGRGTGLGLSMVHGLASQSKGLFKLTSEPGKGTVAEILLPVAQGSAGINPKADHHDRDRFEDLKLNILAVDDDALVLFGTVAMLEDMGHEVVEAGSGAAALRKLAERSDVDLVITDQAMPNMTGVELAHAIHEQFPELPIILASGYAEMPEGAKDHFAARLDKPFSERMLGSALRNVLCNAGTD
ncbi:MAG: response regulator [Allopontixanthobacter sediminis]